MERQADAGNNKQQHEPWSTSVGRKGVLFFHALHFSSEFIHEGAHFTAAVEALAARRANQTPFSCSLCNQWNSCDDILSFSNYLLLQEIWIL